MQSVKSYEPRDKVAKPKRLCGFLKSKKPKQPKVKNQTKSLGIKNNPKVIFRAILYILTSGALLTTIIISAYNVIRWRAENEATRAQLEEIYSATSFKNVDEEEDEEDLEKKQVAEFVINTKNLIDSKDKYWTYIKVPLMEADLGPSIAANADTAGWIQVPGTNIDYPYVQTDNNNYYLNHTINRSWSSAGWVFLDYRNDKSLDDKNQIIYAHGRVDGSMFGSLATVLTEDWLSNEENHVVKISTASNNSLWQVFSVYKIKVTEDYLQTSFIDDARFQGFIDLIKGRSIHDFETNVTPDNQILTLSTCASGDERIVLHAKLIKKGAR